MSVTSAGLDGLRRAEEKLRSAAENIARSTHLTAEGPRDTVELSADVVRMIQAGLEHAAAVQVIQTQEEMQEKLLDVLA